MQISQQRQLGLAIAAILLAVVLLAAIAIAISLASRFGNANSSVEQNKLLATTIMNQAEQVKTNMEVAMSNGLDLSTVTSSWTAPMTSFSMGTYGFISEIAPVKASTNPGSFGWLWHGTGYLVKIMNVGTGAGNYVLELDPLTIGVCQQINQGLFNSTNILTVASSWDTPDPVDASADTALDSKQEGCFWSSPDHRYFYYKVVLVQ